MILFFAIAKLLPSYLLFSSVGDNDDDDFTMAFDIISLADGFTCRWW